MCTPIQKNLLALSPFSIISHYHAEKYRDGLRQVPEEKDLKSSAWKEQALADEFSLLSKDSQHGRQM